MATAALVALVAMAAVGARAAVPPRPNIAFILSDDLGVRACTPHCGICWGGGGSSPGPAACWQYGDYSIAMEVNESSYRIPTPNVARMAKAGLKFARGYSGQVCAPSRTMLMTGKHLGHTTIRGNDGAYTPLLQTDVTVAKALSQAGYHTGIVRARRPPTCAKIPPRRDPALVAATGRQVGARQLRHDRLPAGAGLRLLRGPRHA